MVPVPQTDTGGRVENTKAIGSNLIATQSGTTTRGFGSIRFSETVGGVPLRVSGTFQIGGSDSIAGLPAGCTLPTPTSQGNCQQTLPFDFIGTSNVQLTIGGTTVPETLVIESPYWNPWGGPIYLASPDGAILIVATYTQGSIIWTGAQTGGTITGTLGGSPVSGYFSQTSLEYENLVAGTATDAGTIQFYTNVASLNSKGTYTGRDTIPGPGTDCTSITGLPMTCTETGFQSNGNFRAGALSGSYSTTWGIPAYQFSSTVNGQVSQNGNSQHQGQAWFNQLQSWFGRF